MCDEEGMGEGEIRPDEPIELVEEERGDGGYSIDSADDDEDCEAAEDDETARAGVVFSGRR
jgi:hypothetical protein